VLKTSEMFPYDYDANENNNPRKDRYLRPEFVCAYERPLKSDAKKDFNLTLQNKVANQKDEEVINNYSSF
jgi:hypothetical protein